VGLRPLHYEARRGLNVLRMVELATRLPGTRLVDVDDREADIMDGDGAGLRHTGCAGPGRQAE
jgi:hypothetical protein